MRRSGAIFVKGLEGALARKTMNRRRHRSTLKTKRTRRAERSRHSRVLSDLATLIRNAERRRRSAAIAEPSAHAVN
jgi:hypothetical protein